MSTTAVTPLIAAQELYCGYGPVAVLKGVSIELRPKEIVSIIGANGAGKTTLLRCLSGLIPIASGAIIFSGQSDSAFTAHDLPGRGIAHIPEGRQIFSRLTVEENLELGAYSRPKHQPDPSTIERVFELFPILKDRARQLGGTLSGGEQQMLAIGRALMSEPRVLLMDEPSMGVAPLFVERIFQTIKDLNNGGMSILLVEQNAHLALEIADRGYVLETGRVVLADSAANLRHDTRVREAYLGE